MLWNELIASLPNPHFLQTYEWGQVKAKYGWEPIYLVWDEKQCSVISGQYSAGSNQLKNGTRNTQHVKAAALILKKTVIRNGFAARLCLLYCPKGPLLDWNDEPLRQRVLDDLQKFARQQGAIFLKLDPDVVLGTGIPGAETDIPEPGGEAVRVDLSSRGWRYADEQIQFKNTVLLKVGSSEEEMLARMKQKTRYNVRLGPKKGVTVRVGGEKDWPMLYKMYAETSVRDGFVIRDENYYRTVWQLFGNSILDKSKVESRKSNTELSNIEYSNIEYSNIEYSNTRISNFPLAEPLIAEVDGEPVAAVFLFAFAGRAYYVYGMSCEAHREKMPNYLLQWEALKWAQAHGCGVYDLWGAPDEFDESDSLWGVFRFKEGLGGQVVRTLGAWDFAPNPLWYAVYAKVMPRLLDVMRSRGKARVEQDVEN